MKRLIKKEKRLESFTFSVKSVDVDNYVIEGIFSTPDVDRHGEAVIQAGWDLENYKRNPVVLWAHNNQEFPIGQMMEVGPNTEGNLAGKIKFAVEEYDKAATAFKLMSGKFLRAFSVGFANNVYEVDQGDEVIKLTENELYEVSIVNVPANALALAKQKGIDVSAFEFEEETEQEKAVDMSDETIEKLSSAICAKITASTRVDKAINPRKVETPTAKGGNFLSKRTINKAIRQLLKERKTI
jgi:HK97 family phage prohead protease